MAKIYKLADHHSALVSLHKVMIGSGPMLPYLLARRRYRVNSQVFAECFTGIFSSVSYVDLERCIGRHMHSWADEHKNSEPALNTVRGMNSERSTMRG